MAKLKKVPGALVWYKGDLYVISKYRPDWWAEDNILTLQPITGTRVLDYVFACEVRLLKEPADGK